VARLSIETTNTSRTSVTLTITSPPVNGRTSTGVTGKVTDTRQRIWNVFYWLTNFNNGTNISSGEAVLTAGAAATGWSVTNIPAGTNIIAVQAIDMASNHSVMEKRKFFYEVPAPLNWVKQGTGGGVIVPKSFVAGEKPTTNALNIGETYQLTAKPDAQSLFGRWTVTTAKGAFSTNRTAINFEMETNSSVTADFETNIFFATAGTYNGLFYVSNELADVTGDTAGMLNGLVIRSNGDYSGKLWIDGAGHPINGFFDAYGHATCPLPHVGGGVMLEMTNVASTPPYIYGEVLGTNNRVGWSATNLWADFAAPLPPGQYTVLIPPNTNTAPGSSPGGEGYVTITNKEGTAKNPGLATITGALADGTGFSQSTTVSESGYLPLYANANGNKELILGWIDIKSTNAASNGLAWIQLERRGGRYALGFTNVYVTNLLLSPWSNNAAAYSGLSNLIVAAVAGETNASFEIVMTNNSKFVGVSNSTPVSVTINPKTGVFTVTIGSGRARTNGYGAILQSPLQGGGYFLTTSNAQSIKLQP
jgi:hypothetical protein